MPADINSFNKGLRTDKIKSIPQVDSYVHAEELRLISDSASSSFTLSNFKGNEFSFTLTDKLINVVECEYVGEVDNYEEGTTLSYDISIGGVTATYNTDETLTPTSKEVMAAIVAFIKEEFPGVNITYNNFGKLVIQEEDDVSIILNTSEPQDNVDYGISNTVLGSKEEVPLYPIGHTLLRDDFILITTSKVDDDVIGTDQVWRISFVDDVPAITLVLHRDLNHSQDHPVKAVAVYENRGIQRLYWSDNFNPPKSTNLASENIYMEPLDLQSSMHFDRPRITEIIDNGTLDAGWYGVTYRLISDSGSSTTYTPVSNIVFLTDNSPSTEYHEADFRVYDDDQNLIETTKALKVVIDEVDTDYNYLELAVVYKAEASATYLAYSVNVYSIDSSSFEALITGNENTKKDLSQAEIIIPDVRFDTVKAMAVKDNRIFFSNVNIPQTKPVDFDARVQRFRKDSAQTYSTSTNPSNSLENRGPESEHFKYKKLSSVMGGTGEFIEYSFVQRQIGVDSTPPSPTAEGGDVTSPSTFKDIDQEDLVLNGKSYPGGANLANYANPILESLLAGYKRGEVYRFGILFYDTYGTPLFVEWIDDIRMPQAWEDSHKYSISQDNLGRMNILGTKFKVTVPADLSNKVGGYSIVRAARRDSDKTITAQALMFDYGLAHIENDDFFKDFTVNDRTAQFIEPQYLLGNPRALNGDKGKFTPFYNTSTSLFGLIVPDFYFTDVKDVSNGHSLVPSDILRLHSLERNGTQGEASYSVDRGLTDANQPLGIVGKHYYAIKDEGFNEALASIYEKYNIPIEKIREFKLGAATNLRSMGLTTSNNRVIRNLGNMRKVEESWYARSVYNTSMLSSIVEEESIEKRKALYDFFLVSANYFNNPTGPRAETSAKILFDIYKKVEKQYGGTSVNAIQSTQYISTGHFRSIKPSEEDQVFEDEVWGGDTYVCNFDFSHAFGNTTSYLTSYSVGTSMALIFPVETSINMEWRTGQRCVNSRNFVLPANPSEAEASVYLSRAQDDVELEELVKNKLLVRSFSSKPLLFKENSEFDTRTYYSEVKINGEITDSWGEYKPFNFYDVDSAYGPINETVTFNDNIYFLQDRSFGVFSINPRAVVSAQDGIQTELGTGAILGDHQYVSNALGTKHQWSVIVSPFSIMFFDIINNKLCLYMAGKGIDIISDTKEMFSYFSNAVDKTLFTEDNPYKYKGIVGTYDAKYSEYVITFLNPRVIPEASPTQRYNANTILKVEENYYRTTQTQVGLDLSKAELLEDYIPSFTIAYSQMFQAFTSFYGFKPTLYLNNKNRILSVDPTQQDYYLHDRGLYGSYYDKLHTSRLSFFVNKEHMSRKVFDYIMANAEVSVDGTDLFKLFDTIEFSNDKQTTGLVPVVPGVTRRDVTSNARRDERDWTMQIKRNEGTLERIRDKFMRIDLSKDNVTENEKFLLHFILTYYRVSARK